MIEAHIKELIEAFKPNLFFSNQLPEPKGAFPVMNFFVREIVETAGPPPTRRISFEMRIFAPFPVTCKTFDDALLSTKDDVLEYQKYLRTFIEYLKRYYGYLGVGTDQFTYQIYDHKVSEHDYIAVTVTGFLYEKGPFNCCDDLYFDSEMLPSKGWGNY